MDQVLPSLRETPDDIEPALLPVKYDTEGKLITFSSATADDDSAHQTAKEKLTPLGAKIHMRKATGEISIDKTNRLSHYREPRRPITVDQAEHQPHVQGPVRSNSIEQAKPQLNIRRPRGSMIGQQDIQVMSVEPGSDTSFIHVKRASVSEFARTSHDQIFKSTGVRIQSIAIPEESQLLPEDVSVLDGDVQDRHTADVSLVSSPDHYQRNSRIQKPSFHQTRNLDPNAQGQGSIFADISPSKAPQTDEQPPEKLQQEKSKFGLPSIAMTEDLDPNQTEHWQWNRKTPVRRVKGDVLLPSHDDMRQSITAMNTMMEESEAGHTQDGPGQHLTANEVTVMSMLSLCLHASKDLSYCSDICLPAIKLSASLCLVIFLSCQNIM